MINLINEIITYNRRDCTIIMAFIEFIIPFGMMFFGIFCILNAILPIDPNNKPSDKERIILFIVGFSLFISSFFALPPISDEF